MSKDQEERQYLVIIKSSCSETDGGNPQETTVYLKKKEHFHLVVSLALLFRKEDCCYGDLEDGHYCWDDWEMLDDLAEEFRGLYAEHKMTLTDDSFREKGRWVIASPMVVEEGCDYHRRLGLFNPHGGRRNDDDSLTGWFTRKLESLALRTCTNLTPEVTIDLEINPPVKAKKRHSLSRDD